MNSASLPQGHDVKSRVVVSFAIGRVRKLFTKLYFSPSDKLSALGFENTLLVALVERCEVTTFVWNWWEKSGWANAKKCSFRVHGNIDAKGMP